MAKKRRTAEQIIRMLKQAEVQAGQGKTVEIICRELGISDATYYKWRKEYGGWVWIRPVGSRSWRWRTSA